MTGPELARAAEALAGTPFRLHGRDPTTGLDCIGLLAAALAACGRPSRLPNGYSMRNLGAMMLPPDPGELGFAAASGGIIAGDVLLLSPGPGQLHLAIAAAGASFVHAHAGLGKVVVQPGPPSGEVLRHWRPIPIKE
jgi:cell wall-associated NlpC family hydrolase